MATIMRTQRTQWPPPYPWTWNIVVSPLERGCPNPNLRSHR